MAAQSRLEIIIDSSKAKKDSDALSKSLKDVEVQGDKVEKSTKNTSKAISETGTSASIASKKLSEFREKLSSAAENRFGGGFRSISNKISGLSGSAMSATPIIADLAASVGSLIATYLTLEKVVNAQRTYDKQIAGLETATKSAENAKEAYAALSKFAVETPYGMDQAVEGFTKLVNLGLTPSERALRSYGNTASAMGKDLMQFIEAVADASTGEFERLKEFGIKASKQGEQVSFTFQGTTTKVKNNAKEIEEYLTKLGENEFAGAMAKRMDSLDGSFANLEDSWSSLYLAISQAGVGDLVKKGVDTASDSVQGLTDLVQSGAIQTGLSGITTAFSIFGGDTKSEMNGVAEAFGLTSDLIINKWKATISELNAIGNAWTMMRSWVQKASVSVAAGWDIITDPFNRETSNEAKQKAWKDSIDAIEKDATSRVDAVSKAYNEAEKKYKDFLAKQEQENKKAGDALEEYKVKAKDAGDAVAKSTEKANQALEKQKKLIEGLGKGYVSNANLKGLNIKGAESIAGGQIKGFTAEFAQLTNSSLGPLINRFTAFNDSYHKGTNSKHATGNAFDLTLDNAKDAKKAVGILEAVAKRYGYVVKVLDEYSSPSKRATGGHLHVSVLGKSAKEAWNDIQDEVALIGKGNAESIRLAKELANKRNEISRSYFTEEEKLAAENSDKIKAINEAYATDETNRNKYLKLQADAYAKDLAEFKKKQEAKKQAAWEATQNPLGNMLGMRIDALSKSSLSPLSQASFNQNAQQQDGYSQLGDELNAGVNAINSNEYLSQQEKNTALLALHQQYLAAKKALDEQYAKDDEQLNNQAHASTLAGYANMFGGITSLMQGFGDDSSSTYKTMFALQKAFALSSAILNSKQAILDAYAKENGNVWMKMAAAAKAALDTGVMTAAIQAVSPQGFSSGGYTGNMGRGDVAGVVHGQEYVLNAAATKRVGVDTLNAINSGGSLERKEPKVIINNYGSEKVETSTNSDGDLLVTIGKIVKEVARSEVDNRFRMAARQGGEFTKLR
ncbi:tape measure protein [Acinetobacter baumannii]|nr:hypothetical protein [Acinetobacter baumannii]EKU2690950.1 hypothetical protein [Acinetobacter baumannii]EKU5255753.1 hypothetical protein [Acinetobacter baumannii]EKU6962138.1 hypothetical protein [Acinetobacter baumannii]EKU7214356.1 hypothetical protein [Acinetobacter baumannii]